MYRNIIFAVLLTVSTSSFADLLNLPHQQINSIRAEGSAVLLSFVQPFAAGSGCRSRVWLGSGSDSDKMKVSIALMAFASGKNVYIRAYSDSQKVFGECQLYDIVVVK